MSVWESSHLRYVSEFEGNIIVIINKQYDNISIEMTKTSKGVTTQDFIGVLSFFPFRRAIYLELNSKTL